jgi:hypothetical protein
MMCGAVGGMTDARNRSTRRKTYPSSALNTTNPHDPTGARTPASAVKPPSNRINPWHCFGILLAVLYKRSHVVQKLHYPFPQARRVLQMAGQSQNTSLKLSASEMLFLLVVPTCHQAYIPDCLVQPSARSY